MRTPRFDVEAPFWRTMGRIGDIILLNALTLVACLPVVTAGAALTALYDGARRLLAGEGGSVTALFFRSFRSNFRQATALWGIVAVAGVGVAASWWPDVPPLLVGLRVVLTAVYLLTFPFVWVLQARFVNTVPNTLRNAFVVAFGRPRWSLGVLAVHAGILCLAVAVAIWLPQGLLLLLLLGYPLVVFAATPLAERAIAPLLAQASQAGATGVR
ncbi:YesL family protein [Propionicicella superfundia]|uniref:YesL family protein n=1 Tax=Propionicicella superfundia TaxID=348582 RepID=UPI00042A92E9|nr:YesL family protein [Propionicicella superfundia]